MALSGCRCPTFSTRFRSQIDRLFQSGASAVVISVLSFAVAAGSIAWIVSRVTASLWPAAAAAFVFVINPNLLYLQSTPMTEPLMLGVTLLAVAMLVEWCVTAGVDRWRGPEGPAGAQSRATTGVAFALACLTRYEAWPVTAVALAGAVLARRRGGETLSERADGCHADRGLPRCGDRRPSSLFSRIVVGQWFASGFFVAENPALGHPGAAANQILTGVRSLGGTLTTVVALVGLAGLLARGLLTDAGAFTLVALAPAAAAAVPWVAFLEGHPHRVRYMVPLLAAQAIGIGAAAGPLAPGARRSPPSC